MLLLLLPLFAFSSMAYATGTNGFLLFEIDRYPYGQGRANNTHIQQGFKVPLTDEFMSQFKNKPSPRSMGTGFYCGGGNLKTNEASSRFTWWLDRTTDNRWSITMWGQGTETIAGVKHSSSPPNESFLTIKELSDLDMGYQLSYVALGGIGINVTFTVKYVSAKSTNSLESIPLAPVKKADRSDLFKGDDQSRLPLGISCGFQEN